jgi:hypothetical protein
MFKLFKSFKQSGGGILNDLNSAAVERLERFEPFTEVLSASLCKASSSAQPIALFLALRANCSCGIQLHPIPPSGAEFG